MHQSLNSRTGNTKRISEIVVIYIFTRTPKLRECPLPVAQQLQGAHTRKTICFKIFYNY